MGTNSAAVEHRNAPWFAHSHQRRSCAHHRTKFTNSRFFTSCARTVGRSSWQEEWKFTSQSRDSQSGLTNKEEQVSLQVWMLWPWISYAISDTALISTVKINRSSPADLDQRIHSSRSSPTNPQFRETAQWLEWSCLHLLVRWLAEQWWDGQSTSLSVHHVAETSPCGGKDFPRNESR